MGHLLFVILHLVAILFALVGLFVTIPLHIIYAVVRRGSRQQDTRTRVACPMCKELVLEGARLCKHCGATLAAPPLPPKRPPPAFLKAIIDWISRPAD